MTTSEESDYRVHIEHRLTRLEILVWVTCAASLTSTIGVRIFDSIYIWGHP